MKKSTRKLFTILAALTMAFSFTASQAPIISDLFTPQAEIVEHENESENKEPDCKPECEDDYKETEMFEY